MNILIKQARIIDPHSSHNGSIKDIFIENGIIKKIQEDGSCWCGGTNWQGQTAMRISVSSWATTEKDVKKSLSAILKIAGSIIKKGGSPLT